MRAFHPRLHRSLGAKATPTPISNASVQLDGTSGNTTPVNWHQERRHAGRTFQCNAKADVRLGRSNST